MKELDNVKFHIFHWGLISLFIVILWDVKFLNKSTVVPLYFVDYLSSPMNFPLAGMEIFVLLVIHFFGKAPGMESVAKIANTAIANIFYAIGSF